MTEYRRIADLTPGLTLTTLGSRMGDLPGFGTDWGRFSDLDMMQYDERVWNATHGGGFFTNEDYGAPPGVRLRFEEIKTYETDEESDPDDDEFNITTNEDETVTYRVSWEDTGLGGFPMTLFDPRDLIPFGNDGPQMPGGPDFWSLYASLGSRVADLPGFGTNWGSHACIKIFNGPIGRANYVKSIGGRAPVNQRDYGDFRRLIR